MRNFTRLGRLIALAGVLVLGAGIGVARADAFCEEDCAAECDPGDTGCQAKCCEDVCKRVQDECKRSANKSRGIEKKQCNIDRKDDKNRCEEVFIGARSACLGLACSNDPNNNFDLCRRAAKDARKLCKNNAKATRDTCKLNANTLREQGEINCEIVESNCVLICQGGTPAP